MPTPDETLTPIMQSTSWIDIGKGSFNQAFVSAEKLTIGGRTCYWVVKEPLSAQAIFSASARAVRKWNEVNPEHLAHLSVYGMVVPYFGKTPASDEQIATKMVEIYYRTRNLIFDAASPNNFLVHEGKVICIDVDVALRRGSDASKVYNTGGPREIDYLSSCTKGGRARTASVVRTLLYLQSHLSPEDVKDEYITLQFIEKLHVFRRANVALTPDIMERLLEIIRFDTASEITDEVLLEFVNMGRMTARAENGKAHVIHLAAKYGLLSLVQTLVSYNPALIRVTDDHMKNALFLASAYGRDSVVELLRNIPAPAASLPLVASPYGFFFLKSRNNRQLYQDIIKLTVLAIALAPISMMSVTSQ